MIGLLLLCLVAPLPSGEPAGHEKQNALYQQLRQKGIAIAPDADSPLPAPSMADGLDSKAQARVIRSLIGEDIDYNLFVDNSVNSPQLLLPLRQIKGGDPQAPARGMDLYFVAYGKLSKLTDKQVLERVA